MNLAAKSLLAIALATIPAAAANTSCEGLASTDLPRRHHHQRTNRHGRRIHPARKSRTRPRQSRRLQRPPRLLPRASNPQTNHRLRHQSRSLAPHRQLEQKISGRRQRRMGWRHQLFRTRRRPARRLRHQFHRHRARRRQRQFRPRPSRKADRFRLALRARDDREIESHHPGLLRRCARACRTGTAAPPEAARALRKRRNSPPITTASSPAHPPIAPRWPCG